MTDDELRELREELRGRRGDFNDFGHLSGYRGEGELEMAEKLLAEVDRLRGLLDRVAALEAVAAAALDLCAAVEKAGHSGEPADVLLRSSDRVVRALMNAKAVGA
jgi:hypothetical protein